MAIVHIDGARGEGGGQVLRSALTLSILTGTPTRLTNIRGQRPKPGLMAQHLKAVEAAAAMAQAHVAGAALGSQTLLFEPRAIRHGAFRFDIGTAGATSLVLQTLVVPLSAAGQASSLIVTGGTHVPWSPCFDYLQLHWLPYMRQIGFDINLALDVAGFNPRGGGRIRAAIRPAGTLSALHLTERGKLRRISGISGVSNLHVSVAERQRAQALRRLTGRCDDIEIDLVRMAAQSPGTVLLLLAEFEGSRCCYAALGARGKPAERVADEAVDALEEFLATDAAIDQYLADQLVLPLACAGGVSELRTAKITRHLVTNAAIVRMFLPVDIAIQGEIGTPGLIRITPASPAS
jgi:RNA 3'-terminal phosphate cyclase (ATP)